jgi:hypothetical protein
MWWGRVHQIEMQDVDEDGELFVSEIIPTGPPDPERRTFSCHGDNWRLAIPLGRAFGWRPKGARLKSWRGDEEFAPDPCYEPDGWIRGVHEVSADDAASWAVALERCVDSATMRAISSARCQTWIGPTSDTGQASSLLLHSSTSCANDRRHE